MWVDLDGFVSELLKVYSRKNPLRMAECCDSLLTPKGAKGYLAHDGPVNDVYKVLRAEAGQPRAHVTQMLRKVSKLYEE